MQLFSTVTKRLSTVVGAVSLVFVIVSFYLYFSDENHTVMSYRVLQYSWDDQPNWFGKRGRSINVDHKCAASVISRAYSGWIRDHPNSSGDPLANGAPGDKAYPDVFWPMPFKESSETTYEDLGLFNITKPIGDDLLGEGCLIYKTIYRHPIKVEYRSDISAWIDHGRFRPGVAITFVVVALLGMSGVLGAVTRWIVCGRSRGGANGV